MVVEPMQFSFENVVINAGLDAIKSVECPIYNTHRLHLFVIWVGAHNRACPMGSVFYGHVSSIVSVV